MKKWLIIIALLIVTICILIYNKAEIFKTKFEVEYIDKSYDIVLITSAYDAMEQNKIKHPYNMLYLLSDAKILNTKLSLDTYPTSANLSLINDEIIFENYGNVIKFKNEEVYNNNIDANPGNFANYIEKYITKDKKIIYNTFENFTMQDTINDTFSVISKEGHSYSIIGYNVNSQKIISILEDADGKMYLTETSENKEVTTPLSDLLPELKETENIIGGLKNGEKLITNQNLDLNLAADLYPIKIWDLKTGKLDKVINQNESIENKYICDMFPEVIVGGDKYIITLSSNGIVNKIDIDTGETVQYDISHLKLNSEYTSYLHYVEEDDSLYLVSQPLNNDKYIMVYDITENKVILKVEVNRFEQFYSGFIVNNKNKGGNE